MSDAITLDRLSKRIDWGNFLFITSYHVVLFIALPLYLLSRTPGWPIVVWSVFLLVASLVSITAGYHRLYAHKTYDANPLVKWVLVFFGTLAVEGSVLNWVHDHRLHHRHVDGEGDPYGTHKGFWHSHMLWLFKKRRSFDDRYVADLKDDRFLAFQHRYYGWLMAAANVGVFLVVGWTTGDFMGAFVFAFLLRLAVGHHCTWFINSLAHIWGSKPYSTEHSAVNNFILALLTYGEGYHNYHHTFAGDYRNGVRWYQFDPPKYLIWTLSKLGLASNLKRTEPLMIKKKLVQADRKLLIEHLEQIRDDRARAFAHAVETTSEKIAATISSAKAIRDRYTSIDRKENQLEAKELKAKFRDLKHELTHDLKTWRRLTQLVIKLDPVQTPHFHVNGLDVNLLPPSEA